MTAARRSTASPQASPRKSRGDLDDELACIPLLALWAWMKNRPLFARNHPARRRSRNASEPTIREITLANAVGSISGTVVTSNDAENEPALLS